ncbi:DUF4177 domain-containing protein [Cognatishimia sp. SS12]|uniref:DUF4177 domain-containing protein n=1 Tax=Cognatishimia sp. SS12 TaxID=2979465 RepID=UPI00232C0019|nr:DUF4177 domain-containing protein [Cognatishimia sp. SS12]MDC0736954.1 DUF4177 domain-containing protein [Cognatishimia sp. SS12]
MDLYEYKVVPAPSKGRKARGVKKPEARFAYALETLMNDLAADRWEFWRSETLPSEERSGLRSTTTVFRSVMVFRRLKEALVAEVPVVADPLPIQEAANVTDMPAEPAEPPIQDTEEDSAPASLHAEKPSALPAALRNRARAAKKDLPAE